MAILSALTHPGHAAGVSNINTTTTTSTLKSPYVSVGITLSGQNGNVLYMPSFTPQTELWFSGYFRKATGFTQNGPLITFSGGGNNIARVYRNAGNAELELWNGASWVDSGETPVVLPADIAKWDVHLNVNDAGTFAIYVDGLLFMSFSGDTLLTAQTTVDSVLVQGDGNTSSAYWSAMFVADEDSRTIEVNELLVTGGGNYTGWAGTFADVDEITLDGIDFIDTNVADTRESFVIGNTDAAFASGWDIMSVGVIAKAKKGASGPANLQLFTRSGATDGNSASVALEPGYDVYFQEFTTDPNTATAWTAAGVDAAEVGVQAKT